MSAVIEIFSNIRINDIIDILIVAYVFYKILILIKETRAEQLVKGIMILIVILKLAELAKLYVVRYILQNTMTLGMIALVIVFQPELRRALEHLGRSKLFRSSSSNKEELDEIEEIKNAVISLARERIGALIVIEDETGLNEIIQSGVTIGATLTKELLINIFIPNTPLHDGAVVVRRDKIMAAGCFLPLTENKNISKQLGTRHRAAIGIAEQSDAIVVIVSEETGTISIARDGKLEQYLDSTRLVSRLREMLYPEDQNNIKKKIQPRRNIFIFSFMIFLRFSQCQIIS